MESGARPGEGKNDGVGLDATKAIEVAHNGFFHDLNAACMATQDQLIEAYKNYARTAMEAQTQAAIQSSNEGYVKAVQAAYAGSDVAKQISTAFEKYKTAATQALGAKIDPGALALLSQSMYIVAMCAGQLQPSKATP